MPRGRALVRIVGEVGLDDAAETGGGLLRQAAGATEKGKASRFRLTALRRTSHNEVCYDL